MNTAAQDIGAQSLRHDGQVIGLVALAHGTSHFFHLLIPPLFPFLMRDFGLGYAQVGFLVTVFFVISGAGQAVGGLRRRPHRRASGAALRRGHPRAVGRCARARAELRSARARCGDRRRGQCGVPPHGLHAAQSTRFAAAPRPCVLDARARRQRRLGARAHHAVSARAMARLAVRGIRGGSGRRRRLPAALVAARPAGGRGALDRGRSGAGRRGRARRDPRSSASCDRGPCGCASCSSSFRRVRSASCRPTRRRCSATSMASTWRSRPAASLPISSAVRAAWSRAGSRPHASHAANA